MTVGEPPARPGRRAPAPLRAAGPGTPAARRDAAALRRRRRGGRRVADQPRGLLPGPSPEWTCVPPRRGDAGRRCRSFSKPVVAQQAPASTSRSRGLGRSRSCWSSPSVYGAAALGRAPHRREHAARARPRASRCLHAGQAEAGAAVLGVPRAPWPAAGGAVSGVIYGPGGHGDLGRVDWTSASSSTSAGEPAAAQLRRELRRGDHRGRRASDARRPGLQHHRRRPAHLRRGT